jgi:hypothetical protein
MAQHEIDYTELTTGYEFAPVDFRPNGEMVTAYLGAIEGDKHFYEKNKTVPPMAVAALSMAAMAKGMSLPPGTVHVSQELHFLNLVSINEALTSYAKVNRKVERGKFNMLTVGINVVNQEHATVMAGETSFILPLS